METQLSTIRMTLTSILVDLLWSLNVEKDVSVFAEGIYIYYFVLTKKGDIFMKANSKKHETQKLVNIINVVERSSRYLFYLS